MPRVSAGLALDPLLPRPELVYPPWFRFRKSFWVSNAIWYSVLEFDVFTSYETWSSLAAVRINGLEIGRVPPRGYSQTGGELAPVAFLFANGMLQTVGAFGRTGTNTLEVVPPTDSDWMIVGNWRIHFQQFLPYDPLDFAP